MNKSQLKYRAQKLAAILVSLDDMQAEAETNGYMDEAMEFQAAFTALRRAQTGLLAHADQLG